MTVPIVDKLREWLKLDRTELVRHSARVASARGLDLQRAQELAADQLGDDIEHDPVADSKKPVSLRDDGVTAVAESEQSPHSSSAERTSANDRQQESLRQQLLEEQRRAAELEAQLKKRAAKHREKSADDLERSFKIKYPSLTFEHAALDFIIDIASHLDDVAQIEKQLGLLQNGHTKLTVRDRIVGTKVDEIGYGKEGRIYVRREGSGGHVLRIGNKKTQKKDIGWIRNQA